MYNWIRRIALLACVLPVYGQSPVDRIQSQHQTLITSAVVDRGAGTLKIVGKGFGVGKPLVGLDGTPLEVSS